MKRRNTGLVIRERNEDQGVEWWTGVSHKKHKNTHARQSLYIDMYFVVVQCLAIEMKGWLSVILPMSVLLVWNDELNGKN